MLMKLTHGGPLDISHEHLGVCVPQAENIHEHGQKLWGVPFLKKLRAEGQKKFQNICLQNQPQNLPPNLRKKLSFWQKSLKFCFFPKFCIIKINLKN
jgi:hypothetical protein